MRHRHPIFGLTVAALITLCFGATPSAAQTSVIGQWSLVTPLPYFPVHTHMLPTGKVMIWPGDGGVSGDDPRSWDPSVQSVTSLTPPGYDIFCTGHSFLADGTLFVAGGHISNNVGLARASIYNPFSNAWTNLPNMNAGRWYPTTTVLANGDVLVVSGDIDLTVGRNTLPQVFQVATGTWRNLTGAQLQQSDYPMMLLAPNGRVFHAGLTDTTSYLDTSGTGAWSFVAARVGGIRDYGSAVMYAPGKVLVMGGGDPPTNTAEVIDLNEASPSWRPVGSMQFGRRQLNATLLPDGKVLVTGGSATPGFSEPSGHVDAAELWDPVTENWTTLASSSGIFRGYHSAALLLPDGRVLSTGGNGHPETEIYSPPYLFKGTRPTITSAPASIAYGQSFVVKTDAAAISKLRMLRLSSVTHAFNQSQYINELSFSQTAGDLNVTAPPAPTVGPPTPVVAPPGYYLLFILNGNGVPSVASFVQLTQAAPSPDFALSATPSTQSVAAGGSTTYTVTVTPSGGFSGTVGFSASGLPAGASASFSPTTVSGSGSTTMTVTTASSTPLGSSPVTITGTSGLSHQTGVTLTVTSGGTTGSLSGALATPSGTQNLTSLGTVDWAHWGLTTAGSFNHKAGVTQQISNFTIVGTGPANRYSGNAFGYSWTGGTPTGSATNSTTGIYILGVGNGFKITAPADTTQRTLTVYVSAYNARGQMLAHLSDSSSPDYVNSTLNGVNSSAYGAYTFTYKAASSGQTLSVTFTDITNNGGSSNVTLQAATLVGGTAPSPDFVLSPTPSTQSVAAGGSTTYTVTVTPSGGFSGTVGFSASGLPTGATASFNPTTVSGSGSTTMTVTTASSTPVGSSPVTITGTSGSLSHQTGVTLAVTASADFSLSATPSTQSVAAGGSTTYTVTVTTSGGFSGTVGFSASGLPAGASASFNPTTVSGSGSTTMTVTTASSTPLGSSPVTITGTSGLSHQTGVTLTVTSGGTTGSLSGSLATPSGTQNLTSLGTVDWAHWGLTTAGSFNHKAGVTQQISNFTIVGTGPANRYTENAFGYSWTGGTPTGSATNSTTGIYILGVGNGFKITAPADTTQRTLTVYVSAYNARGQMLAHLSDSSSPDYVNSTLNGVNSSAYGTYTFTYKAASSGQTLSVTFTDITSNGGSSNVTLQAARRQ